MAALIRSLQANDREQWDTLWAGYLVFYETELSDEQTELTWQRLLDDDFGIHGLVAEVDGKIAGLAHFSFSLSTWNVAPDLYLEDLFVDSSVRGQGIARSLILRLADIATETGSRKVWWETQAHNEVARSLYDKVGELSEFVKYTRSVD